MDTITAYAAIAATIVVNLCTGLYYRQRSKQLREQEVWLAMLQREMRKEAKKLQDRYGERIIMYSKHVGPEPVAAAKPKTLEELVTFLMKAGTRDTECYTCLIGPECMETPISCERLADWIGTLAKQLGIEVPQ